MAEVDIILSVVVPVYGVEKFLHRCVNSILAQDVGGLEVILVDDGSPDECPRICDAYASEYSCVRTIHKPNGGASSARNAGLAVSRGKYVTFVDPDDWLEKGCVSHMLALAVEDNLDIVAAGYRYVRPWKVENKVLDGNLDGSYRVVGGEEALRLLYFGPQMFVPVSIMVWNKIYRRELFDGLRFAEGMWREDVVMTPLLLFKSKRIGLWNRTVYNYNIHLGSTQSSNQSYSQTSVLGTLRSQLMAMDGLLKNGCKDLEVMNRLRQLVAGDVLEAYYRCHPLRKHSAEGWDVIYSEVRQTLLTRRDDIIGGGGRKARLFYFSPRLFCALTRMIRAARRTKYLVECKLTGKN